MLFFLEMSRDLAEAFSNAVVVEHAGGHYVPASSPQKHEYQKFFKLQLLQRDHGNELD